MAKKNNSERELGELTTDVKWIRKALEGNGQLGLIDHVEKNTEHRIKAETTMKIIKYAAGGGWAVTLVTLIAVIL